MSTDTDITTGTVTPITDGNPPVEVQPVETPRPLGPLDGHNHGVTTLCGGGCTQTSPPD